MSVFRRKRTNRAGKLVTDATWTAEVRDHNDVIRRFSAFSSRAASVELERAVRRLVALKMSGTGVDVESTRFLENAPADLREKLAHPGIGVTDAQ